METRGKTTEELYKLNGGPARRDFKAEWCMGLVSEAKENLEELSRGLRYGKKVSCEEVVKVLQESIVLLDNAEDNYQAEQEASLKASRKSEDEDE